MATAQPSVQSHRRVRTGRARSLGPAAKLRTDSAGRPTRIRSPAPWPTLEELGASPHAWSFGPSVDFVTRAGGSRALASRALARATVGPLILVATHPQFAVWRTEPEPLLCCSTPTPLRRLLFAV
ncbi:hypothetical protein L1887_60515 [Cichorium endivia]|nr:hypothetical protein L1887_60515 [Cichorium endivia]